MLAITKAVIDMSAERPRMEVLDAHRLKVSSNQKYLHNPGLVQQGRGNPNYLQPQ